MSFDKDYQKWGAINTCLPTIGSKTDHGVLRQNCAS